jgi:hypothetical protein
MSDAPDRHDDATSDQLHPLVWMALVGLILWFVGAVWWGFASDGYVDWLLFVVSAFLLMAVSIQLILAHESRVGEGPQPKRQPEQRQTFGDWAAGEFQIWQDHNKAGNAAAEILTPIAAAAVGMTAFAIAFHYVALHASS